MPAVSDIAWSTVIIPDINSTEQSNIAEPIKIIYIMRNITCNLFSRDFLTASCSNDSFSF